MDSSDESITNELSCSFDITKSIEVDSLDNLCVDDVDEVSSAEVEDNRMDNATQVVFVASVAYYVNYLHKMPCRDREYSGWAALMDILNGNPTRCYENFRMQPRVFHMLCKLLVEEYGLKRTQNVSVEEQVAIFFMIVGVNQGNRQCQEIFQRSGWTVSKSFHRVLRACIRMSTDWVVPFNNTSETHSYIKDNNRYYPHFKDCIGAIDGTHVPASLPVDEKIPFIGRKGKPTQNVMAVCDFDMYFTYTVAGWEGSAHDTRIFYNTIRDPAKRFPMPPPGKYYLVDAGYPNTMGFLSPYRGNRMHLSEFNGSIRYRNHNEAFNHRHSSLRCTIERCFGVWKAKWAIWSNMPKHIPFDDQVALVPATMALHNFIRFNDKDDADFLKWMNWVPDGQDAHPSTSSSSRSGEDIQVDNDMDKIRNDICLSIAFSRIGIPTM